MDMVTKHFAKVLSIHQKSVGRAMKRLQLRDSATQERRGRSVYYGKDVDDALFQIWEGWSTCVLKTYTVRLKLHEAVWYFL